MWQWLSTRIDTQRLLDRSPPVLFSFLKAWLVKRKIRSLRFFCFALRHICVMAEGKLTGQRELHLWPPLYRTKYDVHFADSVHRKKKVREFPVPSRDVITKLSLGGNNDVITELFLPRGSLVSDIPTGDGKLVTFFYGVGPSPRH
jgi:hypothetical protein